jgi:hypothetical protein
MQLHEMPADKELTLTQAAQVSGKHRSTLWSAILNRNLRARKIGDKYWVIAAGNLRAYLARR